MGAKKDTSEARYPEGIYLYGQYEMLSQEEINRMRRIIAAIETDRERRTNTADHTTDKTINNSGDDFKFVPEGE